MIFVERPDIFHCIGSAVLGQVLDVLEYVMMLRGLNIGVELEAARHEGKNNIKSAIKQLTANSRES